LPEQDEAEEAKQPWRWMGRKRVVRKRKDYAVTVSSDACRGIIRFFSCFRMHMTVRKVEAVLRSSGPG
jgi:hypothetical protein